MLDFKQDFVPIFTAMCEFYERELSDNTTQLYYSIVCDLTAQEFINGVKRVMYSRQYPSLPLPAEIIAAVKGSTEDNAEIAIRQLEEAVANLGSYKSVAFADAVLQAVINACGGWEKICSYTDNDWKYERTSLLKLYKAYKHTNNYKQVRYLAGRDERVCGYSNTNYTYVAVPQDGHVCVQGIQREEPLIYLVGYTNIQQTSMPASTFLALISKQTKQNQINKKKDITKLVQVKKF